MSAKPYTEAQLVQQPAIGLFAEFGWERVEALAEIFGKKGTLGRETPGQWC
jgi:type I restriction enzyme R subunit